MECAYINTLLAPKVKYVWINKLSTIGSAARYRAKIFQLSVPTIRVTAGLVLNSLEAWATPGSDLGRHLVMKTTGMPRFGGGRQQGGIQWFPLLLLAFLQLRRMVAMTTEDGYCFPILRLLFT